MTERNTAANEERELRAVATLLRGLPDPEPPDELIDRVLAVVAQRESRPKLIRLLRPLTEPAAVRALAAGIGCLAIVTAVQGGFFPSESEPSLEPLRPSVAKRVSTETFADASAAVPRQSVMPPYESAVVIDAQEVLLAAPSQPRADTSLVASNRFPASPQDERLDRQLNHLLLDPSAFYQRLDRVRNSERFVARLADRAARRGDAAEMALQLRQRLPEDARTDWMVERLLRAALVQHVRR